MQDSKGYIWFATDMGVSRFDGYEFKNFSSKDGLPDMTVFNIYEDYKGRIWFTTYSGKLAYYYEDNIYPFKYNEELQKRFTLHDKVYKNSFYVDPNDNVFVSVYRQGYFKISQTGEITQYKYDDQSTYNLVQIDSSIVFLSYYTILNLPIKLNVETGNINTQIG
ncbi:hypothetical protein JYU20_04925, partial [Bacteroidales bacterium AH-315-I05]|nr:hypothetical protein [Bacteroidales bacterium AH-315-I05]